MCPSHLGLPTLSVLILRRPHRPSIILRGLAITRLSLQTSMITQLARIWILWLIAWYVFGRSCRSLGRPIGFCGFAVGCFCLHGDGVAECGWVGFEAVFCDVFQGLVVFIILHIVQLVET